MEEVLKQLESRIEELVTIYRSEVARSADLEGRIGELETEIEKLNTKLSSESDAHDQVKALETQRDELAGRLEKVLGLIDGVLAEKG